MNHKILVINLLFMCIIILSTDIAICSEAVVHYAATIDHDKNQIEKVRLACDILGIKLATYLIDVKNYEKVVECKDQLSDKDVIIVSEKLADYFQKFDSTLFEKGWKNKNILIFGIRAETNILNLKKWSENKIENLKKFNSTSQSELIEIVKNKDISKELGGLKHRISLSDSKILSGFALNGSEKTAILIKINEDSDKSEYPIFAKIESYGKNIFFLTKWDELVKNERIELLQLLPWLMFLKYSFENLCWHRKDDFANFTIDDPWLREPYGYINFSNLCKEAQKIPFHVTFGFIPYNYKKNHDDAIQIFRKCKDHFSIAIHGNNHCFTEFTETLENNDNLNDKNILQALDRMKKMSEKLDIPYDRVMIFPRGQFTIQSLPLLKKHNFLMTINSTLPQNADNFENSVDRLRAMSFQYGNFPVVLRWNVPEKLKYKKSVEEIESYIRIRLFLDLPVLLYGHVGFFKDGSHAFNMFAEMINNAQPYVKWDRLTTIAKNLYLERKINEDEIEVIAYSSDLEIKNNYGSKKKYIVYKDENYKIPISSVTVDNKKHKFDNQENLFKLELIIEPAQKKNIRILYNSKIEEGIFEFSDNDIKTALIRTLSDFRDIYLTKIIFGDNVIALIYHLGGKNVILAFFVIFTGFTIAIFLWIIRSKKKKGNLVVEKSNITPGFDSHRQTP